MKRTLGTAGHVGAELAGIEPVPAITFDKARVAHPTKLYIDGLWCSTATAQFLRLINLSTEDFITRVATAGAAEVELGLSAARQLSTEGRGCGLRRPSEPRRCAR